MTKVSRTMTLVMTATLGSLTSCGPIKRVQEVSEPITGKYQEFSDPMAGKYEVIAYDVPSYGNVDATFTLKKVDGGGYQADIRNDLGLIKVHKTEVNNSKIFIEATAVGRDIYFDLEVRGDSVIGWLSDMYRVAGIRVSKF